MFGGEQQFCVVPETDEFNDETTPTKVCRSFNAETFLGRKLVQRASKFYSNRFSFDYNGALLGELVAPES